MTLRSIKTTEMKKFLFISRMQRPISRSLKNADRSVVQNTFDQRHFCDSKHERRFNEINIQMLSRTIHEQIFPSQERPVCNETDFSKMKEHLSQHGLWGKECTVLDDVALKLPEFEGRNVSEHFENIAKRQTEKYLEMAQRLATSKPPPFPEKWLFEPGWTKYMPDGTTERMACPEDDAFVFDVEVCMNENELPVMATAASENAW